jgi:raffinose/stachyose/melibiose transport system substrate-binding protein
MAAARALALVFAPVFILGLGAGDVQATKLDPVSLTLLAYNTKPAFDVLIPNFERVYPNITIDATYTGTSAANVQLTQTELAAGNGPDLISTFPGCGTPLSICDLVQGGYLAPLLSKPWTRWSLPLITSLDKDGAALYAFTPTVSFEGLFTNDDLFKKLGLKAPETFSELLTVCRAAKDAGTVPLLLPAQGSTVVQHLLEDVALTTVYAGDRRWTAEAKAGTVTFDGTPGWHAALQELVDLNSAGCFEPGPAGTTSASAEAEFARGQALMYFNLTGHKGAIDLAGPTFAYSQHPFPSGNSPARTMTQIDTGPGLAVNAHASAPNQYAAQLFVDFIARPAQDALYARLQGSVTQFQFLHAQLPAYLASFAPVLAEHRYALDPEDTWWNPGVATALNQYGVGLLTGQSSIDDVLNAMDAAWKQGPA